MKTMSITEGRAQLGRLCRLVSQGHDIGIVCDGKIYALREAEVYSTDYALREYGLKEDDMNRAARTIHEEIEAQRKRGNVTPYKPGRFSALGR